MRSACPEKIQKNLVEREGSGLEDKALSQNPRKEQRREKVRGDRTCVLGLFVPSENNPIDTFSESYGQPCEHQDRWRHRAPFNFRKLALADAQFRREILLS